MLKIIHRKARESMQPLQLYDGGLTAPRAGKKPQASLRPTQSKAAEPSRTRPGAPGETCPGEPTRALGIRLRDCPGAAHIGAAEQTESLLVLQGVGVSVRNRRKRKNSKLSQPLHANWIKEQLLSNSGAMFLIWSRSHAFCLLLGDGSYFQL